MDKEAGPKGMSRRDFLKAAAVGIGALGTGSGLSNLYSDDIGERVYEDKKQGNNGSLYKTSLVIISPFKRGGHKNTGIISEDLDLTETIPSMLREELDRSGIRIVSEGSLITKLKNGNIDYETFKEYPGIAVGILNGIDALNGDYYRFYGHGTRINVNYIDLSTGEIKPFSVSDLNLPHDLEIGIRKIADDIMVFMGNGGKIIK